MKGLSSYDHSSRLWARWLSTASRFFLSWDKTSMHRTIFFCWQLYISTKFYGISQNFVQLGGDFNSPWSSSLLPNKLLPRPTFSAELTCQPSQLESIESIFAPCQTVLCGLRDKSFMECHVIKVFKSFDTMWDHSKRSFHWSYRFLEPARKILLEHWKYCSMS